MSSKHLAPKEFFAVTGKIGSGKDLITSMIQIMTCKDKEIVSAFYEAPEKTLNDFCGVFEMQSRFVNKKFASKIKKITAELLGCTVRQLDKRDFKEKELSEDWWYYKIDGEMIPYIDTNYNEEESAKLEQYLVKLTPRKLQQLIGTEGGRNVLHPNVWVTSTFMDCKPNEDGEMPCWIISDLRFKNELKAVNARNGIVIRLIRYKKLSQWISDYAIDLDLDKYDDVVISDIDFLNFINEVDSNSLKDVSEKLNHPSEVELDDVDFKYTIHNGGSIEELVNELREILILEGVLLTEAVTSN